MSYNAGGIDITLDARIGGLEANLRRAGVQVKQTTAQMADDAKKADAAISGMGGRGGAVGAAASSATRPRETNDEYLSRMMTGIRPAPTPPPTNTTTQNAAHVVQAGTFAGVTQAFRQFFGRGGAGAGLVGGGLPPAVGGGGGAAGAGGGGIFQNGANIGGSGFVIGQVARDAFRIGQILSDPVMNAIRGGKGTAEMESRADRNLDPKSRRVKLQEELDQANAEMESFLRNKDSDIGRIKHYAMYPEGLLKTEKQMREYIDEKESELQNYSQQESAERISTRARVRKAQFIEQQESQRDGKYSINDLVMASQATAANTELLNMIVTRMPR